MKTELFLKRPILATGISVLLVLLGIIGLATMPVEQFPELAPPTISVTTEYPGANAETVLRSVVTTLEESINGVENMMYMTSTSSSYGNAQINVFFRPGTDPDMAAVNVQNRVSAASARLPEEVNRVGVTTRKRQTGQLLSFVLTSPDGTFDRPFLVNYLKINIQSELLRVPGVGDVYAMGQDYALRVRLDPLKMAQYRLMPSDIRQILEQQNIEVSMGELGEDSQNTFQFPLKYTGRLVMPEEFGNMVVRALPDGSVLHLRDLAEIELGEQNDRFIGEMNGKTALLCSVYQMPGSNATEITDEVLRRLEQMEYDFPKGMELRIIQNNNEFLYASIENVVHTLLEALVLVILVVLFFLHSIRVTLIPIISILVSLIGTFAVLAVCGFTINLLTLFAFVLVIGTVVDDSIVVVEAVQARFESGITSPYQATRQGLNGIDKAIVTSSLVFMAVFIPVCFISGSQGTFYTQFGVAMAVAVGLSAINALTLCPALCVLLMRPQSGTKGLSRYVAKAYHASFTVLSDKYISVLPIFLRKKGLALASISCILAILILLMKTTPTGFIPAEDMGMIYQDVSVRPGSSLATTHTVQRQIADELAKIPQIESYTQVSGNGFISGMGSSYGYAYIRLKPWSERKDKKSSVQSVIADINARMAARIKDAKVLTFAPPMITGYGTTNAIEMHLQDRNGKDIETFYNTTQEFLNKLSERPEIARAYSSFDPNFPQYQVKIDAALCQQSGVSPDEVLEVLGGYCGGVYASDFNRFNKMYRIMLQAKPEYRLDEASLNNMFVRISAENGEQMAPVSRFVTLIPIKSPLSLYRFNQFNSISVNINTAEGYSSGDAIDAISETAAQYLPHGYSYEFAGMSREQNEQTDTSYLVFGLCLVFIYLLLMMLYESFFIPFAVLLSVPFGLAGSFLFARIGGLENNIYLQTGLIMLIGLLAKTAILLTEYATELRASGMSLTEAALSAAKARLRPILMTVLTMIIGMLPMMLATGVGANGNHSLGTSVVGGMVVGILALLFVVPVLFVLFQGLHERLRINKSAENEQ